MEIKLCSLRVKNCGPLRDVKIEFEMQGDSPITVLGGANGSGKTTVLELITGLAEILPRGYTPRMPGSNEPEDSLEGARPTILGRIDYAQADWLVDGKEFSLFAGRRPRDANLPRDHFGLAARAIHQASEWAQGPLVVELGKLRQQQEGKALDFPEKGDLKKSADEFPLPSILYFPHTRLLAPIAGQQIQREETAYQWVYRYETAQQFAGSLDSYLVWLDYAEPGTYARVIDFLNEINFEGKTFRVLRKELRAVVKTRDGHTHGVAELSSGEQNILIMLLELRRRLLPHSIVLIDEIENSLHPAFQYRLAQALKRLQETIAFQLIVTTHAPAFLEIFGPESARILTEF